MARAEVYAILAWFQFGTERADLPKLRNKKYCGYPDNVVRRIYLITFEVKYNEYESAVKYWNNVIVIHTYKIIGQQSFIVSTITTSDKSLDSVSCFNLD